MRWAIETGGWLRVSGVPGWESHVIRVRAEVIEGEARVTSLQLTPQRGTDPALAAGRLRSLPLRDIARMVLPSTWEDSWQAMQDLEERPVPRHDPRAAVSLERFAEAWRLAEMSPEPTRETVCGALTIAPRTYDRYRRRALDQGLIPQRKAGK